MSESAQFKKAVEIVRGLPKDGPIKPTQDDQLYFYARYKLGKGETVDKPGMFDFVGKAKWTAYNDIKDKSPEVAQHEYVEKLKEILAASGDEGKKLLEELNAVA